MMPRVREDLERELAVRERESDDLRLEMEQVRHSMAGEVDRTWTSAWKSPETVDAKIRARLAGHAPYQALRARQRELDEACRSRRSELETGSELEKGMTP
jgi:hypothetical protein